LLPGVHAPPDLRTLRKLYAMATTFNHTAQPFRSAVLGFLNGMRPECEGFPFNMLFPVFQEGKPRDPPSLALGLGPGFIFNSPFERMK